MSAISSQTWRGLISCLPNAGLPELRCGHTHYPLTPDELAGWIERFIAEDGIDIVGGCCGTAAEHIAALDAMLRRTAEDGFRPRAETARSRSTRPRSPRCSRPCRCARRTRSSPSASAATPTAPRNSASCRRPATGTAASPWAASRCARAATRSTSAPPSSAATRSPR